MTGLRLVLIFLLAAAALSLKYLPETPDSYVFLEPEYIWFNDSHP